MKNSVSALLSALLCTTAFPTGAATPEPLRIPTRAESVVLFIDGAQVTRREQADIPAGASTLRFTGLSPYLDEKSLQVGARGAFTVISVDRIFDYADSLERSGSRQELRKQIAETERRQERNRNASEILEAEHELLKTNCSVAGRSAATPLADIRALNEYYAAQLRTLKEREEQLAAEKREIAETLQRLRAELAQEGGKAETPASEVEVRIEAAAPCRGDFTLSYYVRNAGWFPTYDIRSAGIGEPIELVYKAAIFQHTREEWQDVALTLSSANPSTGNTAPQLRTWWLDYGLAAPRYDLEAGGSSVSGIVFDAETREPLIGATVQIPGTTIGTATDVEGRYDITLPPGAAQIRFHYIGYKTLAQQITGERMNVALQPDTQALEEVVVTAYGASALKALTGRAPGIAVEKAESQQYDTAASMEVAATQNRLGYEFEIRQPYTVHSDGKSVTAEIGRFRLPAAYRYEAMPRADRDAFLVADATQWEQFNLLQGEANLFFEQTFVGKSILDPAQTGDTLRFSLGRDNGLRIERTKRSDYTRRRTVGQNLTQSVGWQFTLRNTRREPVQVTLRDQLPVSRNSTITVTEEELSGGGLDRTTGIVTWSLTLAPGEQRELELRYTVKYPKNRSLVVE